MLAQNNSMKINVPDYFTMFVMTRNGTFETPLILLTIAVKLLKSVSFPNSKCPFSDTFKNAKFCNNLIIRKINIWHNVRTVFIIN